MDPNDLIKARERLLKDVVKYFRRDPAVLGIVLGGSLPAGKADAFSDIDLRVIVEPGEHQRFVDNRRRMPHAWGELLFNEWIPGATHCVSHFRPFGKIDVFYVAADRLTPSPWLGLPTEILHDPQGLLADVIARSKRLTFEISADEVDRTMSRGLAAAHEVVRRIRRGELCHAQSLLDELRNEMAHLNDLINRHPPQAIPLSGLEERADENLLNVFAKSYVPLEPSQIESALLGLAMVFKEQLIAAHERFRLSRRRDDDLHAISIVLQREVA